MKNNILFILIFCLSDFVSCNRINSAKYSDGEDGLYGNSYDGVANQFVLNKMDAVLKKYPKLS